MVNCARLPGESGLGGCLAIRRGDHFRPDIGSDGAAYWLARSVLDFLQPLGMNAGLPLMAVSNGLTAVLTNLMADGPAAAAVGPIALNMPDWSIRGPHICLLWPVHRYRLLHGLLPDHRHPPQRHCVRQRLP